MQERVAEAVSLARRHSRAPHFARSLEWLLFTSLELNAGNAPSPSKSGSGSSQQPSPATGAADWSPAVTPERRRRGDTAGPLLLAAASLLRNFPQVRLHCHGQWPLCMPKCAFFTSTMSTIGLLSGAGHISCG